jgi:hypothetical protein
MLISGYYSTIPPTELSYLAYLRKEVRLNRGGDSKYECGAPYMVSTAFGLGQGWRETMWDCFGWDCAQTTMTRVMTCRLAERVGCLARLKRPCQPSGFKTGASTADGGIGTVPPYSRMRHREGQINMGMDRSTGREGHLRMILKYANIPRHRPPPLLRCPRPHLRAV